MLISVRNLSKSFGSFKALRDVTFDISEGEKVALWGANGAGKTTLLRCMLGITKFEGEIFIDGVNVKREANTAKKVIGFVPQGFHLPVDYKVEEILEFFASIREINSNKREEILKKIDLYEFKNYKVSNLSGGMKQKLALAIAMLPSPKILFLDEPTANLDLKAREDFYSSLIQLRDITLIFTTHRLDEVYRLADRLLILERGVLVRDRKVSERANFILDFSSAKAAKRAFEIFSSAKFYVKLDGLKLSVKSCCDTLKLDIIKECLDSLVAIKRVDYEKFENNSFLGS